MKKKTKVIFKAMTEPKVGCLSQTQLLIRLLNSFENIVFGITKIGFCQIQLTKLFQESESDIKQEPIEGSDAILKPIRSKADKNDNILKLIIESILLFKLITFQSQ